MPEIEVAVKAQWPNYVIHLDEPHPSRTYVTFLREAWKQPEDLVIVEGDCLPPAGSIAALLTCERPWCSYPAWLGERYVDNTLGLVKFSAGLRQNLPDLAEWALTEQRWRWGKPHPKAIDVQLAYELGKAKIPLHVHQPPVIHLRYANDPGLRPAERQSPVPHEGESGSPA